MKWHGILIAALLPMGTTLAGNAPALKGSAVLQQTSRTGGPAPLGFDTERHIIDENWRRAFAFADRLEAEARLERVKADARWYDPLRPFLRDVSRTARLSNTISIWAIGGLAEHDSFPVWANRALKMFNATDASDWMILPSGHYLELARLKIFQKN